MKSPEPSHSQMIKYDNNIEIIYLDLSYKVTCEFPETHTYCVKFYTPILNPSIHGIWENEREKDNWDEIQATIIEMVEGMDGSVLYVANSVANGIFKFYFYVEKLDEIERFLTTISTLFSSYEFTQTGYHDPDWNTYKSLLFPGPLESLMFEQRRALYYREEQGDKLDVERPIKHLVSFPKNFPPEKATQYAFRQAVYFRKQTAISEFKTFLHSHNFSLLKEGRKIPFFGTRYLKFARKDQPQNAERFVREIISKTLSIGATYEGWESEVIN